MSRGVDGLARLGGMGPHVGSLIRHSEEAIKVGEPSRPMTNASPQALAGMLSSPLCSRGVMRRVRSVCPSPPCSPVPLLGKSLPALDVSKSLALECSSWGDWPTGNAVLSA